MRRTTRAAIGIALSLSVSAGLCVGFGAGLVAAPPAAASSDKSGVAAVTTQTAALVPGQSAWVSVVWTAQQTVTGFSTKVSAPAGVAVSYPTTRGGSDTSLYGSDTLVGQTKDFTAFKLSVPYSQTSAFQVTLTSSYVTTPGNSGNGGGGGENAQSYSTSATVTVPIVAASGPVVTLATTRVAIAAGSNGFQQIAFTAGAADLNGVTMTVGTLPPGLQIAYPGDKASAGLNGGSTLVGGTTDYAAVRLDASGLKAGTYALPVTLSYMGASAATFSGTVQLVVS